MNITPPTRTLKPKPVALITPGYRSITIETEAGPEHHQGAWQIHEALTKLEGHTLYVNGSLTQLRHTTGARVWQASTWRGRATAMKLDGTKVKVQSLRGCMEGSSDPYGDLLQAVGWFDGHGVRASGLSSMGWALWRSTLEGEVDIRARPSVGRPAMFGGRQGARLHLRDDGSPRPFQNMAAVDITGAYPHAMASRPLAVGLRSVSPSTALDPLVPGIAQARVGVDPRLPFGPLPERLATDMIQFPSSGFFDGQWAWCELVAARELGCTVTVTKCWAPTEVADLFNATWTALVAEARTLSGGAARLAKNAINATWGLFGMRGDDRATIRWDDDAGLVSTTIPLASTPLPHATTAHIAAEIAARVRVRMLTEGLYGDWPAPVHVDTDGVIVRASAVKAVPTTGGPGQWRRKTLMRSVEVRAPQIYRYVCREGCGVTHIEGHYVTAGTPPSLSRELFERFGNWGTCVSFNGLDIVIPAQGAQDIAGKVKAAKEARSLIGALQHG